MNASISIKNIYVEAIDIQKRCSSIRQLLFSGGRLDSVRIPILKDISFEAHPGDRIGIVGRNGSGKSSLLKVIAGIYPPISGSVSIQGKLAPLIEMGVGFDPELSARANIKLSLCYTGRMRDYSKELEQEIITFAELEDKIDMPIKTFSSGMVARLAFAVSVLQNPDILLLDEVLATGDALFVEKSYNFMRQKLDDVGIAVLVNHSSDVLETLCNKCIFMEAGHLVAMGPTKEILELYKNA